MSDNMICGKKKALICAQAIGAVFGLILGLSAGYEAFWEVVGAVVIAPIACAALLRFCVRAYQFAKVRFGVKVQDTNGDYVVIEKPGRGIFAAIIALFLPVVFVTSFAKVSHVLLIISAIVLLIAGAFFCYLDIRYVVNCKREKKNQY